MLRHLRLLRQLTSGTAPASLFSRHLRRGLTCSCARLDADKLDVAELTQEEMDKLQGNPYFGKYADKLKTLQE